MSTSRHIDRICVIAVVAALVISILFMNGEALGLQTKAAAMGYESRLFDTGRVHTIDIVIDDWDAFLSTCQSEEYAVCSVVIDGESYKNVGIRGKGNTSLSNVASMESDRYSFKIEFDQYDTTQNYYGLDKLSLNNLIQDNTMMKDYLTYQMMNAFGVAAPLCSYVYITVNGEDWGLYLAVEAVEDSFLQRNYGSDYGELYKPDSTEMGGGRGNGMDFNFEDFMGSSESGTDATIPSGEQTAPGMGGGAQLPEDFDPSQMGGQMPGMNGDDAQQGGFDSTQQGGQMAGNMGGSMDMGSSDTKLQYIDESADSYSSIFDNAKTDVTNADQQRLINALKTLSSTDAASAVDVESVIRYFVVHNFVVNGDSYTGSMIHNYYLYEEDGRLSMIPWDYNLAFGTFQSSSASDAVNDDIDAPLSVTGSDRPMIDWIFQSEEYTALYHQYFAEFLETVDMDAIIQEAYTLIAPYVEKDPTKFCTCEEFEAGVAALRQFCALRTESVQLQLAGSGETVDAGDLNLSDMGSMTTNMGAGNSPENGNQDTNADKNEVQGGVEMPDGTQMPGGMEGMTMPDGTEIPGGMDGMTMPGGMEGTGMPSGDTGFGSSTATVSADMSSAILLVVSLVILAFGLVFAAKFKRRS